MVPSRLTLTHSHTHTHAHKKVCTKTDPQRYNIIERCCPINKVLYSSKSDEWYTPYDILRFVRSFGHIDTDPCAAPDKKKHFADTNFTIEDDGLVQTWRGNVYCNPPFTNLKKWVAKSQEKTYDQLIYLIPARTDTAYWHDYIFGKADEIYFLRRRIKFKNEDGEYKEAPFPSAIVLFRKEPKYEETKFGTLDFRKPY